MTHLLLGAGKGSGAGGGGGYAPPPGTWLGLWDASELSSLTLSTSTVTNVADLSGNSNHLGDGTTSNRPTYDAAGLNSLPTIGFTTSQFIAATSAFPMGTGNTLTFFWVGSMGSATQVYGMPISYGAGGSVNNTGAWYFSREAGTQAFRFNRNASACNKAMTYDAPVRVIGTVNSSGAMLLYVNGVASSGATAAGNWTSPGNLMFGDSFYDATTRRIAGKMSQAGISAAFTNSTDVATLDAYLQTKWGL